MKTVTYVPNPCYAAQSAAKQAVYAAYRRAWSSAVGNPLPASGSGPARYQTAGF